MVAIAKRTKGTDSDLYRKAAEELAQYEREQEDRKTPGERVRELQIRLGRQRDAVARASQDLTQAETDLVQAKAQLQQAEENLGDGVRKVEELESELQAAQALLPKPAAVGEQVQTPTDLDRLTVLLEEVGSNTLPSDQGFQQGVREATTIVGSLAKQLREYKNNIQAAQIEQTKKPEEDDDQVFPDDGPWQISMGTKAHACLVSLASKDTQRHVLNFHKKGKGKGKKGKNQDEYKDPNSDPTPAQAKELLQRGGGGSSYSGTAARPRASATGSLGENPAKEADDEAMEGQLAGVRRKREPGDQDEDEEAVGRDSDGQRSFRRGGAGDEPGIPPRTR